MEVVGDEHGHFVVKVLSICSPKGKVMRGAEAVSQPNHVISLFNLEDFLT